jgi:hypothetical protein
MQQNDILHNAALGITTLSIIAFCITALCIITPSNNNKHYYYQQDKETIPSKKGT